MFFVMETQLPALRWQNPADVTYFSSVWTNDLKAKGSTFAYYSADSFSLSFSVTILPETVVWWGGGGKENNKQNQPQTLLPLKEPLEEKSHGYQWQTHTQTGRKREKKTLFGILKEELSMHTQYPLAKEPRPESVATPTCCAQRRC